VGAQHAAWKRNGPPAPASLVLIARAHGAKFKAETPLPDATPLPDTTDLSDALGDLAEVGPGQDTRAASLAIIERLKAGNG
jgi:hypothetical protein